MFSYFTSYVYRIHALLSDTGNYFFSSLSLSVIYFGYYILIFSEVFPGTSVVKNLPADAEHAGLIPGSGKSPGG